MASDCQSLVLVEDSADDEMLALRAISKVGVPCDVQVVRHGADALSLLLAPDGPIPSLIILDFHLPGFNGLEILRNLRSQERTKLVPIVMMSSLGSSTDLQNCLLEGANSFVEKPMDMDLYVENVGLIIKYWLTVDKRPERTPAAIV